MMKTKPVKTDGVYIAEILHRNAEKLQACYTS